VRTPNRYMASEVKKKRGKEKETAGLSKPNNSLLPSHAIDRSSRCQGLSRTSRQQSYSVRPQSGCRWGLEFASGELCPPPRLPRACPLFLS
jgi:hypothetical protein